MQERYVDRITGVDIIAFFIFFGCRVQIPAVFARRYLTPVNRFLALIVTAKSQRDCWRPFVNAAQIWVNMIFCWNCQWIYLSIMIEIVVND